MFLKSRHNVFKMSVFKKLSSALCNVRWYMYNYFHIKKLSLRAAVASMLGVSDRWICSIIRHSRRFSYVEPLSAV